MSFFFHLLGSLISAIHQKVNIQEQFKENKELNARITINSGTDFWDALQNTEIAACWIKLSNFTQLQNYEVKNSFYRNSVGYTHV